jgi:hypothetical protein
MITEAVSTARAAGCTGTLVVRMDSAFYGSPAVWAARQAGARFPVTVRIDPKIRAAIAALIADQPAISAALPSPTSRSACSRTDAGDPANQAPIDQFCACSPEEQGGRPDAPRLLVVGCDAGAEGRCCGVGSRASASGSAPWRVAMYQDRAVTARLAALPGRFADRGVSRLTEPASAG